MELLISGGITSLGYYLSNKPKNNTNNSVKIDEQINQNNVYNTNFVNETRQYEQNLAKSNFKDARNPHKTNIVPNEMNHNILNNKKQYSQLKGDYVEDMNHNNMVPFFGGSITQNVDSFPSDTILEKYSGRGGHYQKKKEVQPLFKPSRNVGNVFGNTINREEMVKRQNLQTSQAKRTNELPFEQVTVGQGLNQGYSSAPTGGLNQQNTRDFIMPKNIDQLRSDNNPQISYEGRIIHGKSKINNRDSQLNIKKNRPETFYSKNEDNLFRTTGAQIKDKIRPGIIVKDTNRKVSQAYSGSAAPATVQVKANRALVKESTRENFENDWKRNATVTEKWDNYDYGQGSFRAGPNERDVTSTRTHTSNVSSIFKALIAPLTDIMKDTKKENVIGNNRMAGNFTGHTNHRVHDPEDIARTTVKETTVDNSDITNAKGVSKNIVYDSEDVARVTIKETNIDAYDLANLVGGNKHHVYDPEDIARTTVKETNIDGYGINNFNGQSKYKVYDPEDVARTTVKETNIDGYGINNLNGQNRGTVYDSEDVARTTVKETNIDNDYLGHVQNGQNDGYKNANYNAPNTMKQTTIDNNYTAIADKEGGNGYLVANPEAPNTNKQFTSDNDYTGVAQSKDLAQMSYDDVMNATLNEVREGTLVGRSPADQGPKLANGSDKYNIDVKKMECDRVNIRGSHQTRIVNNVSEPNICAVTKDKDTVLNTDLADRNNPSMVDAFQQNPYTQSLNSTY